MCHNFIWWHISPPRKKNVTTFPDQVKSERNKQSLKYKKSLTWWSFACYLDACDLRSLNPPPSNVHAVPPSLHLPFAEHSSSINHSIQHVFLLSLVRIVDSYVSHTCHRQLSYHYSRMRMFCLLPTMSMTNLLYLFSFSSLPIQAIHDPNEYYYIWVLTSPKSSIRDSRCSSWCHRQLLGFLILKGDHRSKVTDFFCLRKCVCRLCLGMKMTHCKYCHAIVKYIRLRNIYWWIWNFTRILHRGVFDHFYVRMLNIWRFSTILFVNVMTNCYINQILSHNF